MICWPGVEESLLRTINDVWLDVFKLGGVKLISIGGTSKEVILHPLDLIFEVQQTARFDDNLFGCDPFDKPKLYVNTQPIDPSSIKKVKGRSSLGGCNRCTNCGYIYLSLIHISEPTRPY